MGQPHFDGQYRTVYALSPSDLTFLLTECPRCFYLKVVLGQRRPSSPMPAVFNLFDRQQKRYLEGKDTSVLHPGLRSGVIFGSDLAVRSVPLTVPGTDIAVVLRGSLDLAMKFEDGTYGIVDLKTIEPRALLDEFYAPQLHAYALGVENPEIGRRTLAPVEVLGLLCLQPIEMMDLPDGGLAYRTEPTWIPVLRDDDAFWSLLARVARVLVAPRPPAAVAGCPWCDSKRSAERATPARPMSAEAMPMSAEAMPIVTATTPPSVLELGIRSVPPLLGWDIGGSQD